jgi:hypothetical protein
MKMKMFSIEDKDIMTRVDSIQQTETQTTSQEKPCKREGSQRL